MTQERGAAGVRRASAGKKILLVDDDMALRQSLAEQLRLFEEFATVEADSGAAMRARLAGSRVDLVLLDVVMPGEDGFALAREFGGRADLGIIMLTGRRDLVDRVVGLEVGADDYVAKPFELREVLARVRTVLRRLNLEQVELEPVVTIRRADTFERLLQLTDETGAKDVVVLDGNGAYAGMVLSEDIRTALWQREAIPLLTAGELARQDVPLVRSTDDLASVLATFSGYDVARLPVCLPTQPNRVIGLVSRSSLMKRYHRALSEG